MLAIAVLVLSAFNLSFRLNSEVVEEWDESLYGLSAWEATQTGQWIATTRQGAFDYYNTKPPLNVWLIALAFKTFGASLWSLRLASASAAWLTVLVLMMWARRYFGAAVALLAGLMLATSFAFMYVHSGKSADTDALFTLLMLLTVVVLGAAKRTPWMLAWIGPLLAATFMLRGMAILMPLVLVVFVEVFTRQSRRPRVIPYATGALLAGIPAAWWCIARSRLDGGKFLSELFFNDFVARSGTVLDGHTGNPLYYLDILQRHHYDWLTVAAASLLLFPVRWGQIRSAAAAWWRDHRDLTVLLLAWVTITLLVPTLMATKLPWYLNPFYPPLAIGVGALVTRGLSMQGFAGRRRILAALLVVVVLVAEAKLIWTSYFRRDPSRSVQGLLFAERDGMRGQRVYRERWNNAEIFVLDALIGARRGLTKDVVHFLEESGPGDYFVSTPDLNHPDLTLVRRDAARGLYRRKL